MKTMLGMSELTKTGITLLVLTMIGTVGLNIGVAFYGLGLSTSSDLSLTSTQALLLLVPIITFLLGGGIIVGIENKFSNDS